MPKKVILLICFILPLLSFAGPSGIKNTPTLIPFADNDQVSVILSNVDVNRISIKGDKIQYINGPAGFCTAKTDGSGAVFLTVNTKLPFTIYLSTVSGHTVSLFVTPRSVIGKTVVLEPTTATAKMTHWEKNSAYQGLLTTLMNGMVNRQLPEGYAYTNIKEAESVDFFGIANITPVAMFSGAHLMGIVSVIQNKTKKVITLKPSYFYRHGIRSVALSYQTIKPLGTGLLYEISGR